MTELYISSVIRAPADKVWSVVRDFNALPDWHPLVRNSRIEEGLAADQIGCVRQFELNDGASIRERLLGLSDYDYSCTYSIIESGMAVSNYIATLKLSPITEVDQTFAEWTAQYDCAIEDEEELANVIGQGVFAAGFESLNSRFS